MATRGGKRLEGSVEGCRWFNSVDGRRLMSSVLRVLSGEDYTKTGPGHRYAIGGSFVFHGSGGRLWFWSHTDRFWEGGVERAAE
ncbi:hypothetical protein Tco_1343291 [Tanacetum coccineum]